MKEKKEDRIKELEAKIEKQEKLLLKKEMEADYLEKMIDLAKEKLNLDVRKFADSSDTDSKHSKKR